MQHPDSRRCKPKRACILKPWEPPPLWPWVDTLQEWTKSLLQHHACPMKPHFNRRDTNAEHFCGFLDVEGLDIAELKDLAIDCGEAENCFLKHLTNLLPLHNFRRNFAPVPQQSRRHNSSAIGSVVKRFHANDRLPAKSTSRLIQCDADEPGAEPGFRPKCG